MARFRVKNDGDGDFIIDPLAPSAEYEAWMEEHRGDPTITIVPLPDDPVNVEIPLPEDG